MYGHTIPLHNHNRFLQLRFLPTVLSFNLFLPETLLLCDRYNHQQSHISVLHSSPSYYKHRDSFCFSYPCFFNRMLLCEKGFLSRLVLMFLCDIFLRNRREDIFQNPRYRTRAQCRETLHRHRFLTSIQECPGPGMRYGYSHLFCHRGR